MEVIKDQNQNEDQNQNINDYEVLILDVEINIQYIKKEKKTNNPENSDSEDEEEIRTGNIKQSQKADKENSAYQFFNFFKSMVFLLKNNQLENLSEILKKTNKITKDKLLEIIQNYETSNEIKENLFEFLYSNIETDYLGSIDGKTFYFKEKREDKTIKELHEIRTIELKNNEFIFQFSCRSKDDIEYSNDQKFNNKTNHLQCFALKNIKTGELENQFDYEITEEQKSQIIEVFYAFKGATKKPKNK